MDPLDPLWLAIVAFGAAVVNGAVGYGFSTIVTPLGVLWFSNRLLNPAIVSVELVVNVALLLRERRLIRQTWGRSKTVVTSLLPGVLAGTLGLTYLAVDDVKLLLYLLLFPLVLLQLKGVRRPIANERRGGLVLGPGLGFLYALTTISGPPLAMFFRNQGLSKEEFRCAVAQVRVAEATLTLGTYLAFTQFLGAGLITLPSISLLPALLGPVLIGVPVGAYLMRSLSREFFARFVMTTDGVIVSYGLSQVGVRLGWFPSTWSVLLLALLLVTVAGFAAGAFARLPTFRAAPGEHDRPPSDLADRTAGSVGPDGGSAAEPGG